MLGFKKNIAVDVHDVDFNGVCRASSVMRYIQSAAQAQLTSAGMSYDDLKERRRAFILSRIKIEFCEPLYSDDIVEAFTFPCHSRGYSFLRCYQLSRGDKVLCRAASVWALIDTESRSLVKVNDFELGLVTGDPYELSMGHFRMPDLMVSVGKYRVAYSDLDRNCHVNNTRYPDIYANFLPLEGKRIDQLTINYKNEAVFGEDLEVQLAESDGFYYIRTIKADGRVNSEAEIHIIDI